MNNTLWTAMIFFTSSLIFVGSPVITSYDSRWAIQTSITILNEGNTDLNEFEELLEIHDNYNIEAIEDKKFTYFPHNVSFLSLPFVFVADQLFKPVFSTFPKLKQKANEILA